MKPGKARNSVLASFAAKGVQPYKVLGTGIRRAIADWSAVDLFDDRDACTLTAIVALQPRQNASTTAVNAPINTLRAPINAPLTDVQRNMLSLIATDPAISYDAMAAALGRDRTTVMRSVRALKTMGLLRRAGSRKAGRWVIGS